LIDLFQIVHKWTPCHREALKRSHVDKTIVLLKIGDRYVPIVETAVNVVLDNKVEMTNNFFFVVTDAADK
jgi:hypothetical protein